MCTFTCIEHSNHCDSQADLTFCHTFLCSAQTQTLGRAYYNPSIYSTNHMKNECYLILYMEDLIYIIIPVLFNYIYLNRLAFPYIVEEK